ncbi:uncharacterized protein [Battus philenor]|uniref:uncharacterized protein isoform X2 n=1 Tax=Battus philenor TaxID=42288 RepID=UPI0035D02A1D
MPINFNVDVAVKHVKTIVDYNRCVFCDKLSGIRLRFSCGHFICEVCINKVNECLTCVGSSSFSIPQTDEVKGQHVQHAENLLRTFQDIFHVDVYRRSRLSEKLEIENKLFPKSIQAPVKYTNKRKSMLFTKESKENINSLFLYGEEIGSGTDKMDSTTMNTRVNLVQKWLENNEKDQTQIRRPFSNINVNTPVFRNRENVGYGGKNSKLSNEKRYAKKRFQTHNKNLPRKDMGENFTKKVLNQSLLSRSNNARTTHVSQTEENTDDDKISNENNSIQIKNTSTKNMICDINDCTDTIVIEDSTTQIVDKDQQAWLAVLEANNSFRKSYDSTDKKQYNDVMYNNTKNVYFYKKDLLYKSCYFCLNDYKTYKLENQRLNSNDVSITIETNSIVTSMTVRNNEQYVDRVITKHSKEIQTDESSIATTETLVATFSSTHEKNLNIVSEDILPDKRKNCKKNEKHDMKCAKESFTDYNNLIKKSPYHHYFVNDSDSDVDIDVSDQLEVTADVHRSEEIMYSLPTTTGTIRTSPPNC